MDKTVKQFDAALQTCRNLFVKKLSDYGASWRIMRPCSITDQIYIKAKRIRSLEIKGEAMIAKNHDYDEAWRSMRVNSYTDFILTKIQRTKQIEDNDGATLVSEGIDSNYLDMVNYAVFGVIKLQE